MATTRSAKTIAESMTNPAPTEETGEPTRNDVFDAMFWTAHSTDRVPCAVGPTASGKTFGIHNILAVKHNAKVLTVLASQHTPDEITGFQLNINGELKVQMPSWFTEAQRILDSGTNVFILFDELGFARNEVIGALLTFFRDRHLHNQRLDESKARAYVVAASNPAPFMPQFRSRCIFFHVPADRQHMLSIAKTPYAKKFAATVPLYNDKESAYSNMPPPPPEVGDLSATQVLNLLDDSFWKLTAEARGLILQGLVPPQTLAEMQKDSSINVSVLARNYEELGKALRVLPRDQKHGLIGSVLETLPSLPMKEAADALLEIIDCIFDDLTTTDVEMYYTTPRGEDIVTAVMQFEPDYVIQRLAERGMVQVKPASKGKEAEVVGSIRDRVEKMIELAEKRDGK